MSPASQFRTDLLETCFSFQFTFDSIKQIHTPLLSVLISFQRSSFQSLGIISFPQMVLPTLPIFSSPSTQSSSASTTNTPLTSPNSSPSFHPLSDSLLEPFELLSATICDVVTKPPFERDLHVHSYAPPTLSPSHPIPTMFSSQSQRQNQIHSQVHTPNDRYRTTDCHAPDLIPDDIFFLNFDCMIDTPKNSTSCCPTVSVFKTKQA